MRFHVAFVSILLFTSMGLRADEPLVWSRFRGPNGSGIAEGQKPPVEIGPDKNVKWKVPAPTGISSPIVAGDNLVITAFDDGKLYTVAYRRAEGKEAWRAEAPAKSLEAFHKVEGSPAASSCATDGKRIVSYFGSSGLFCYDLMGKELWRYELPTAVTAGGFGTGVSPILEAGTVILVRDELKDPKIIALDAATGSRKWEQKRTPAAWCTPLIWDTPKGKQVVAPGHVRMMGYDISSGTEQWVYAGMPSGCCASPVIAGDKLIFAGSSSSASEDASHAMPGFDGLLKDLDKDKDGAISREEGEKAFQGFFDNQDTNKDGKITREEFEAILKFITEGQSSAFALKAGGAGDVTTSHLLWKRTKGLPYVASAIAYRDQVVMVKDGGIVVACEPSTGETIYQERIAANGRYYASPVAANGVIYFTSLENGVITVLQAGVEKPVVLAKNPELGERCAATPAIADNTLYVRTANHLYAFTEQK